MYVARHICVLVVWWDPITAYILFCLITPAGLNVQKCTTIKTCIGLVAYKPQLPGLCVFVCVSLRKRDKMNKDKIV